VSTYPTIKFIDKLTIDC